VSTGFSLDREQFYERRACAETDKFPTKDPCAVRVLLNLLVTFDVAERLIAKSLVHYGLSPSTFNLLMILRQHPEGCVMSALSDLLVVSRANVTGLIDSLEERGLVRRSALHADRRSKVGVLTEAGQKLLEEMLPSHYAHVSAMVAGLPEEDKVKLTELLTKLRTVMQESNPEVAA
jgi:MarR family transcriptional regulator, 2-MHQ and catechol-resistance regulon repressor